MSTHLSNFLLGIPVQWCNANYFVHQGIEYLITNELLNDTPEDIAKFLHDEDGLNKTMIGDYLGEK